MRISDWSSDVCSSDLALTKSAQFPFHFWLPTTYTAAAPPVAAVFAIMSKVGIYVVLRLSLLLFAHGEEPAQFGSEWLLYGGMATIAFGMVDRKSTRLNSSH